MTIKKAWEGDWADLPRHCGGQVEVMDQTIGCDECGANLWNMPNDVEQLPPWAPVPLVAAFRDYLQTADHTAWPYDIFSDLFNMAHPFQFDDCQDPGDENDATWTAHDLHVETVCRDKFGASS